MKFEVLKRSHLKRNIIIGVIAVVIISAIILNFTRAKYRVTQSIPLVNGTINYSLADLNIVAIYTNTDSGYTEAESIPESGYVLNEEESYCTVNNERDDSITLSYDVDTKTLSVSPMTAKGTKCYLYFDEYVRPKTMTEIIVNYNKSTRSNFSITLTSSSTKLVYTTTDWANKKSYYFAGAPTDNWVYFGGFYWRIIRVNGDGSTRLIYNGTSSSTTGAETMINNSQIFNTKSNRTYYVGLSYSTTQHGTGTKSSILTVLDNWYNTSSLSSETNSQYIDVNAGFCSDRNLNTSRTTSWSVADVVFYAAYERLIDNRNPSLQCNNNDILKIPVGLITADEIAFAGGVYGNNNSEYYLYNNYHYWTMSPDRFDGLTAVMLFIWNDGSIGHCWVDDPSGVRPVINLKSDTKFEGSGTSTDPFTVVVE